ncbi:MAG: hypothetical protein O3A87_04850 [Verrucomicrobia bacterium]|nr:hypothetical protein [Verrucomicrobiota bacterium]MDA1005796.1 hypothetical protein [Verrucomicrobiota bacterium]
MNKSRHNPVRGSINWAGIGIALFALTAGRLVITAINDKHQLDLSIFLRFQNAAATLKS